MPTCLAWSRSNRHESVKRASIRNDVDVAAIAIVLGGQPDTLIRLAEPYRASPLEDVGWQFIGPSRLQTLFRQRALRMGWKRSRECVERSAGR